MNPFEKITSFLDKIYQLPVNSSDSIKQMITLCTTLYSIEKIEPINRRELRSWTYNKYSISMGEILDDKELFINKTPVYVSNVKEEDLHAYEGKYLRKAEMDYILTAIVSLTRNYLKQEGYISDMKGATYYNLCGIASDYIADYLRRLGFNAKRIHLTDCGNLSVNHYIVYAELPYAYSKSEYGFIIDATYRQFFTVSRCLPTRLYHQDDPFIAAGYFMNGENTRVASKMIEKGFCSVTSPECQAYGNGFYASSISKAEKDLSLTLKPSLNWGLTFANAPKS